MIEHSQQRALFELQAPTRTDVFGIVSPDGHDRRIDHDEDSRITCSS